MRRRLFPLLVLALLGAALFAPAPASAQSEQDLECIIDGIGLTDATGDLEEVLLGGGVATPQQIRDALEKALDDRAEEIEDCIEGLLPNNDEEFCDDCDPTFDYREMIEAVLRIDRGRALRQSLQACRDRTLNRTHSDDSRERCISLERVFELYINDEGSLEARRKSGGDPLAAVDPGPQPGGTAGRVGLGVRMASVQRLRGGLQVGCRPPVAGLCRVEVLGRDTLIAAGSKSIPAGTTATVTARPTRRGAALLRRSRVVRARVIVRTPGAFTVRRLTIKP